MSVQVIKSAIRGRPRKHPIKTDTTCVVVQEKPREERSFEEFFPDLNIKEPLNLISLTPPLLVLSTELSLVDTTKKDGRALPHPSFEKIVQRNTTTGNFQLPENHYIHYQEPSEAKMYEMVEYDMDEQDQTWLKILNKERKKENLGQVSNFLFEAIIDSLEKEWFNLVRYLPKRASDETLLAEDSTCAVCDDGECENSNAIVFCDGCNLAVHQDCYGIPYIPEGQWLCRKCTKSPDKSVSCLFCPFEDGAFKQTTTGQWGHLLCAVWIPEVNLANSIYMEPIENIEKIPKSRWKLTCYICRRRQGACIQCDNKQCFTAFHVTCARWTRLCMRMNLQGAYHDGVALKAYCERHTPADYEEKVNVGKMVEMAQQWFAHNRKIPRKRYVNEEEEKSVQQTVIELLPKTKITKAQQHQVTTDAPIAPDFILEKLENLSCVQEAVDLKKKSSLITSICRYWSLKRGARRGAPLLKRLQLESWAPPILDSSKTEAEKRHKLSRILNLRGDLEKVRILSGEVKKRERQKLERIRKQKAYLEIILYPIEKVITPIIEKLIALDKKNIFRYPVTTDIASDYFEFIKQPMSFADVLNKLESHQYLSLDEFESDLSLIWDNCMTYNKPDTTYYKLAENLKAASSKFMEIARADVENLNIKPNSSFLNVEIDPEIFDYKKASPNVEKNLIVTVTENNNRSDDKENRVERRKRRRSPSRENDVFKKKKLTRTKLSVIQPTSNNTEKISNKTKYPSTVTRRATRSNNQNVSEITESTIEQSVPTIETSNELIHTAEKDKDTSSITPSDPSKESNVTIVMEKVNTQSTETSEDPAKQDHTPSTDVATKPFVSAPKISPSPVIIIEEEKHTSDTVEEEESVLTVTQSVEKQDTNKPQNVEKPVKLKTRKAVKPTTRQLRSRPISVSLAAKNIKINKQSVATKPRKSAKLSEPSSTINKPAEVNIQPSKETETPNEQLKPKLAARLKFVQGEIVWAAVPFFPPHPAEIIDPAVSKDGIPTTILKAKPAGRANIVLVKFFLVNKGHTWSWVPKSDINPFGNPTMDLDMLLKVKSRKASRKEEVKRAYRHVCNMHDIDPEPLINQVFPTKKK